MTSEMSRMSFEAARPSIDRIMSLKRKVIRYKIRTASEPIYDDELIKNMTIETLQHAAQFETGSFRSPNWKNRSLFNFRD